MGAAAPPTSGENHDREDLLWDVTTLSNVDFVNNLKNPGKKVAYLVAPGPTVIEFDEVFDSILYSVMPGQEMADALVNVLFGLKTPSGKLTFTMPNKDNE